MTIFEAKAVPTDEKLRGGYYTPGAIAEYVAEWVSVAGLRLLEPACGDGNILEPLSRYSDKVQGVELFADEAEVAAARSGSDVEVGDFFTWFGEEQHGVYDGVAGNPPYVRFGN